jgi:hypothetical protein
MKYYDVKYKKNDKFYNFVCISSEIKTLFFIYNNLKEDDTNQDEKTKCLQELVRRWEEYIFTGADVERNKKGNFVGEIENAHSITIKESDLKHFERLERSAKILHPTWDIEFIPEENTVFGGKDNKITSRFD